MLEERRAGDLYTRWTPLCSPCSTLEHPEHPMLTLLDPRAWRACQSRDMLARLPSTSSSMCVTGEPRIPNTGPPISARNIYLKLYLIYIEINI